MEELKTKPTVDIIKDMTTLDQQIDLKTLKIEKLKLELYQLQQELAVMIPEYEELRLEVINRFPFMKNDPVFQPKEKVKSIDN